MTSRAASSASSSTGRRRARPSRRRSLPVRLLRGLAATLFTAFALVTAASLTLNAVTAPPQYAQAPRGQDVAVGDLRVHYEKWDAPAGSTGAPIVLLPGFAESSEAFVLAGPKLAAEGHTVYAVDTSGFGWTRGGDVDDLRNQVDLVSGTIRALGIGKPVVAGHSMGAAVAGGMGLWHPDQVRGVVFVDGDAQDISFGSSPVRSALFRSPYATSLYRIATRWTWADRKVLASTCGSGCTAFDGEAGLERAAARMAPMRQGADEKALLGRADASGILHLSEAQMRAIRVPRGIVWGAEDKRSGGSLPDTRDRLGHPVERIVPGAAHDVMMGNPQGFADALHQVVAGF